MSLVSANVHVEVASFETIDEAIPLLIRQMEEHGIDLARMGVATFEASVRALAEGSPPRGAVLLARSSPETPVIGVAVLAYTWTIEHGGACAWLDELYVSPSARGGGVGTALLHRAYEVARGDSCRAVDLEVDADHARVESLYLREGFRPLPRRRFSRTLVDLA